MAISWEALLIAMNLYRLSSVRRRVELLLIHNSKWGSPIGVRNSQAL